MRNGYSIPEVAAFVSRVSADLGTLTPQDLRRVTFGVARRGYDKAEVIAYLNRLAAEVEAEIAQARELARLERIVDRAAAADPLPRRHSPHPPPGQPIGAVPSSDVAPEDPPRAAPAPPPFLHNSDDDRRALASVVWLDDDPDPALATHTAPEPNPPPAEPNPPPADEPIVERRTAVAASDEIAALLRAAHDNAIRLKEQADADIRHTIETARRQVDEQRRQQERELQAAREAVERDHAAARHAAELEATAIRQRAEQDAAAARAAAAAVLAQAKAEVEAVQALARHNMTEIEAAKQAAIEQARALLSLGKGMLTTVIDLDRATAERLDASRRRTLRILDGIAS